MAKKITRRRRRRDPLRRPEGRARHAGDARADLRADRPGARRVGRASSPTAASRAAPGAWSSATSRPRRRSGGTIALVHEGDSITIDAHKLLVPAQRRRRGARAAARRVEGAAAALHEGPARQVHEARLDREPRRHHRRRLTRANAPRRRCRGCVPAGGARRAGAAHQSGLRVEQARRRRQSRGLGRDPARGRGVVRLSARQLAAEAPARGACASRRSARSPSARSCRS